MDFDSVQHLILHFHGFWLSTNSVQIVLSQNPWKCKIKCKRKKDIYYEIFELNYGQDRSSGEILFDTKNKAILAELQMFGILVDVWCTIYIRNKYVLLLFVRSWFSESKATLIL